MSGLAKETPAVSRAAAQLQAKRFGGKRGKKPSWKPCG